GEDINEKKLNIKEAVDYLADTWKNKKTGILPITTEDNRINAIQIQQEILTSEREDTNQMVEDICISHDDSYATSVANSLNEYFYDLEENILTEDILNEIDIINLINAEIYSKNNNLNDPDDSEEEPVLVSLNDAEKSLRTWISFFEQQEKEEFKTEDIYIFKKYHKMVQRLEFQSKKQVAITNFFVHE
ncbi:2176_t:CDS:2, partial [Racocetra persica]